MPKVVFIAISILYLSHYEIFHVLPKTEKMGYHDFSRNQIIYFKLQFHKYLKISISELLGARKRASAGLSSLELIIINYIFDI